MPAECTGSPGPCDDYFIFKDCDDCGCEWDYEFGWCEGDPDPCDTYYYEFNCLDCGCEWSETALLINIADDWKDLNEVMINLGGGYWRGAAQVWQNIGDVWKRIV